jgi:D-ribose pyranase
MKKSYLLNSEISYEIAKMGHNDGLALGDCGLPIPEGTKRIDLAISKNLPGFIDTLKAVLSEMEVQEVTLAEETENISPEIFKEIKELIGNTKINFVTHESFKKELTNCKAVIRTGEQTPYANIILKSGVVF